MTYHADIAEEQFVGSVAINMNGREKVNCWVAIKSPGCKTDRLDTWPDSEPGHISKESFRRRLAKSFYRIVI